MAWRILWRAATTIITLAAFLVGSLIYIGFYAPHYSFGQDIIVVLVALIIALTTVALIWLSWIGRRGWNPGRGWTRHKTALVLLPSCPTLFYE